MRDSIVFYKVWGELITSLPEQKGAELMRMVFNYAFCDKEAESEDQTLNALFDFIKTQLDKDTEKWEYARLRRSEGGKKGMEARWHKTALTNDNPPITDDNPLISDLSEDITPVTVNENVNVNVNGNVIKEYSAAKQRRFTPPTLQEVADYINSKGYSVDPQAFIDFYESKGWMIGKNKMKSWQSAIGTWERRQKRERKPNGFKEFKQNTYDFDELEKQLIQN